MFKKQETVLCLLAVTSLVTLGHAAGATPLTCEPGESDDCSKCYTVLASQAVSRDRNYYNIQNTFFPPNTSTPVFVVVRYGFDPPVSDAIDHSNDTKVWFWSASTFFLFHPIHVFQFTSLFFSDPSLRYGEVSITLRSDCFEASDDFMMLFTQRLKLYAMDATVTPKIDQLYEPKAESIATLDRFHKTSTKARLSGYVLSYQMLFSILCAVILVSFFIYFLEAEPTKYAEKINAIASSDSIEGWEAKTYVMIVFVISIFFNVYIVILDVFAVGYGLETTKKLSDEVANFYRSFRPNLKSTTEFQILYALAPLLLLYDIILALGSVLCLIAFSCFMCCKKCDKDKNVWGRIVYVLIFPLLSLSTHTYLIIIAFIHSPYHATSVGIFYGILLVYSVFILRFVSFLLKKCIKKTKDSVAYTLLLVSFSIVSLLMFSFTVYIVALYFVIPINNAFDEAPDRIFTVYNSVFIIFAALVTYIFILKPQKSYLNIFAKANDQELEEHTTTVNSLINVQKKEWKGKSDDEKVLAIATFLLKGFANLQKLTGPGQTIGKGDPDNQPATEPKDQQHDVVTENVNQTQDEENQGQQPMST